MSARPFASVEEMGAEIINRTNQYVKRNDTLYMLGDVCWKPGISKWLNQIKCKNIHLIWGNHDRNSFGKYFKSTKDTGMVKLADGVKCFLSHYAHAYWPESHRNAYHAYGHNHFQREATLNAIWPERRAIDVGVDHAYELYGEYRPFSEQDIIAQLSHKKGHDLPEFYKEFQAALHIRRNSAAT